MCARSCSRWDINIALHEKESVGLTCADEAIMIWPGYLSTVPGGWLQCVRSLLLVLQDQQYIFAGVARWCCMRV